jgi:hypothetical protein
MNLNQECLYYFKKINIPLNSKFLSLETAFASVCMHMHVCMLLKIPCGICFCSIFLLKLVL